MQRQALQDERRTKGQKTLNERGDAVDATLRPKRDCAFCEVWVPQVLQGELGSGRYVVPIAKERLVVQIRLHFQLGRLHGAGVRQSHAA